MIKLIVFIYLIGFINAMNDEALKNIEDTPEFKELELNFDKQREDRKEKEHQMLLKYKDLPSFNVIRLRKKLIEDKFKNREISEDEYNRKMQEIVDIEDKYRTEEYHEYLETKIERYRNKREDIILKIDILDQKGLEKDEHYNILIEEQEERARIRELKNKKRFYECDWLRDWFNFFFRIGIFSILIYFFVKFRREIKNRLFSVLRKIKFQFLRFVKYIKSFFVKLNLYK